VLRSICAVDIMCNMCCAVRKDVDVISVMYAALACGIFHAVGLVMWLSGFGIDITC
jgi:hypothetical protein